jgi:hypothetical protein
MTTIIRTLRLFRDQATNNYGDENYHEVTYDRDYEGRIESVGHVDRSIAWPPGDGFRVSDAAVSLADTDRNVRALFDANPTPRRRKGEIKVFQDTDTSDTVDPVYTGEIVPAPFGPGRATIQLRDAVFSWLDKPIWVLGTRDNFPNLPSGVEQEVIPAVFGRLESTATDLPQGKFRCPYVDTINFRYAVARHEIFEFIAAYRKRVNDGYFTVVDPGEYDIITDSITIEGIAYTMTFIEFHAQQEDGTEIRCDASGINSRPAIGSLTALSGVEITNLVDHLLNVVYASEKRDDHYNDTNFAAVRSEITSRGWVFAYAMTDAMTNRDLIALMTVNGLDFFCNRNGELDVAIDPLTDDPDAEGRLVLTEDDILLRNNPQEGEQPDPSFIPANPSEVHNRLRVFYAPYNGMPAAPGTAGNWGFQWIIDNTADQDELAVNPDDPTDLSKEEISVEYPFIHDDDTALAVAEERLGYYTLRSWSCEFDLSLIDFYDRIELAQFIGVTHRDGIKQESGGFIFGWINESMKVVALSYDLDRMTIHVTCVKHVPGADLTLVATFDPDSGHPARDTQTSIPPVSNVSVNATTVSTVNFNDTTPAAPNGKRNVKWQHSGSNVSAYVDNFGTVNAQTGTSYTVADTDEGKLVTLSNSSAIAVTLPTTFASTYKSFMKNLGAGTATLTPSSGTINGSANITLTTGNGAILFFDGANWKAITTGGGDVTGPGSSTDNGIARFDGTTGKVIQNTSGPTVADDGRIQTVTDPSSAQDAATKAYVDAHSGASRGTAALTTASLADQATESSSFSLGKSSLVYKLVADQFCRVRFYSTSAGRDADLSRAPTTQPATNTNLLLDVVMNSSDTLTFYMQPAAICQNMDGTVVSTIYYNVMNLSGASHTVTVTATRLLLES